MAFEQGHIVFRPMSILDPYRVEEENGIVHPDLAVLTHFKEHYGCVKTAELIELEDLINNPRTKENDIQRFFEKHPHFFRLWDYRDVFPHVYLTREDDGPLIPDFILVNPDVHHATIVDLKLPQAKLVRRQKNRERFSATVMEARSQLLQYHDWFDERSNRKHLKERLGIEIYRPCLGVVIGSSSEFRNAFDRQKLIDTVSDVEIVTYDDIIASAQRRLALIKSAGRR
jgi:hypothetical protein